MGHPDTEEHQMCYFPQCLTPPCRRHLRKNKKENQNFRTGESSTMEVRGKRGQLRRRKRGHLRRRKWTIEQAWSFKPYLPPIQKGD